jgi:Domain of Unknown Function with PDB structure (DUF3857)
VRGEDFERQLYHYVRLKIFNERGKEQAATIDIPFDENTSIEWIKGRTIKPDGTEVDLNSDSVYERDVVRVGHVRRRVKSFAMPGVEPAAIVEYRWQEIRHHPDILYLRVQFQREFPVEKVIYYVRPLPDEYTGGLRMSVWPFNCDPSPLKAERDGFSSMTVENVPAFHEEPMMPGEGTVRPWALIYYREEKRREVDKYWNEVGKRLYGRVLKPALHANGDVKGAASEAVEGAGTDDQKVAALIRYIRRNVRDLYSGHEAFDQRIELADKTDVQRADSIKDQLTRMYPDSEVTAVRVAGYDNPDQPVTVQYHIRITGYAQRTGKRLLIQPFYFQRGAAPLFSSSERRYPVVFRYAFNEDGTVIITVPAGFKLDHADRPPNLNFGPPGGYQIDIAMRGNELVCTRSLTFGDKGFLQFPVSSYGAVKQGFDEIHRRDDHTLSLIEAPTE